MKIFNTNELKNNLISKGIKFNIDDETIFNKSDYYQVINAHKMLFIVGVEDIDKILSNINNNIDILRYQNSFNIEKFTDLNDFKNQVLNYLSVKYDIKFKSINEIILELKRIKYIHHIYDSQCSFNDFYRMYEFEHDFRIILLKYVLKIENYLKKIFISSLNDFGNLKDNFLTNIENYNTSIQNYSNSIKTLKEILSLYDSTKSKAITRKVEQNITIPYWILINEMSFNKVLKCIKNLKHDYSNKIYENLIEEFTLSKLKFSNNNDINNIMIFKFILDYIGEFRNMLAHNQPIYNYNIKDNSLINMNNLSYLIPFPSTDEVNNKMKILKTNVKSKAIKACQNEINNRMKASFETFFNKDNFNQNRNPSNFNLSYVIYLIAKINLIIDDKCPIKKEILDLFYSYNILNINDRYSIDENLNKVLIKRKYENHFKFDSSYSKYTGINLNFLKII